MLLVPEGTKRIVRHQFKNLELEEIVLPEGLEWIGAHCFRLSKLRLNTPEGRKKIQHEFGLSQEIQGLKEIRFIADHSGHYHTADEREGIWL